MGPPERDTMEPLQHATSFLKLESGGGLVLPLKRQANEGATETWDAVPKGGGPGALREACDFCSRRKRKCCGKVPCTNCTKLGVGDKCHYSIKQKSGRKKKQRFDEAGEPLPPSERRERPRNIERPRDKPQRKDATEAEQGYGGAASFSSLHNGLPANYGVPSASYGGGGSNNVVAPARRAASSEGSALSRAGFMTRAAAPLPGAAAEIGSSDGEAGPASDSYSEGEDGDASNSSDDGRAPRRAVSRGSSTGSGGGGSGGPTACDFCTRRRRPCDGGQPCRECARHGVQVSCTYAGPNGASKRSRSSTSGNSTRSAVQGALALASLPLAAPAAAAAAASGDANAGRLVLGAAENSHLTTFFGFFGRYMRFTTEGEVRSAAVDAALGGVGLGAVVSGSGGGGGIAATESVASAMWAAVAVGALLGGVLPARVQRYARAARRLAEAAQTAVAALNGGAASTAGACAAALARARAQALLALLHDMLGQPLQADEHYSAAKSAREQADGCRAAARVAKGGAGVAVRHVDELLAFLEAARRDRDGLDHVAAGSNARGGSNNAFPPAPNLENHCLHQGAALGVLAPLDRPAMASLLGLLAASRNESESGSGGGSGGGSEGTATMRRRAEVWHELLGHADRHMAAEVEEPGTPPCPLALATVKAALGWLSLALGRLGAGGDRVEEALQLLRSFPGWVRLPHWGHSAHLLACALAAAGLRESYEDARSSYNAHRLAEQQPALPPYERRGELADCCVRCRDACLAMAQAFPHAFPAPPPPPRPSPPLHHHHQQQQQQSPAAGAGVGGLPRIASTGGFVVPTYPPTPVSPGPVSVEDNNGGSVHASDTWAVWHQHHYQHASSGGKLGLHSVGIHVTPPAATLAASDINSCSALPSASAPAPAAGFEEALPEGEEVTLGDNAFGMFGPGTRVMVDRTLHSEDYNHLLEMLEEDVPYDMDIQTHFDWSQMPVEKQYVTTSAGGVGEKAGLVWQHPQVPEPLTPVNGATEISASSSTLPRVSAILGGGADADTTAAAKAKASAEAAFAASAAAAAATAADNAKKAVAAAAAAAVAAAASNAEEAGPVVELDGMFGPVSIVLEPPPAVENEAGLASPTAASTQAHAAAAAAAAAATPALAADHHKVLPPTVALDAVLWQSF